MDFSDPFDVVVLGGGNAALCAAITAARAGCRVIVVEAAPEFYRGGNTRHTRNLRLAHDGTAPTMTGPYEQSEFLDDLYRVTGGATDETLAKLTVARSGALLSWMDEQGVRFQPPLGGTLSLGKTNAFFLGGGRGALNALYRKAQSLGVTVIYDSPVIELVIESGYFMSATLKHNGKAQSVRGRALVAAAGGFEANIEWLKKYWGEAADNFLIRGTPYNRGEVLRMLLDASVAPVGDATQFHARGDRCPRAEVRRRHRYAPRFHHLRHRRRPRRPSASTTKARTPGPSATPSGAASSRSSRAGRLVDLRCEIAVAVHAVDLSRNRGADDCANSRQSSASIRRADKDRRRLQRCGPPRQLRSHQARRLRDARADAAEKPLGARDRYAAVLRLSACAPASPSPISASR